MFINLALTFYLQACSLDFIMKSLRTNCQLFIPHHYKCFALSICMAIAEGPPPSHKEHCHLLYKK